MNCLKCYFAVPSRSFLSVLFPFSVRIWWCLHGGRKVKKIRVALGSTPRWVHGFQDLEDTWHLGEGQKMTELIVFFSRKRPRRVPSKKALPLKTVIKDCHQTSPKVKTLIKDCHQTSPKVKTLIKDCHQTSPKVLLELWLSLKIVIKHRPKFCWSDGCLSRLSSKAAQSSAEVMAVFKDCHQTSPKVLLKWCLSSKTRESLRIVIKHRLK